MKFLFLTNTAVDWGQLTEYGLAAMVVTAVFVIIVKPIINQILKNNSESTEAYKKLADTIATGDSLNRESTKDVEARVLKSLNELTEPLTVIKEKIKAIKEQLNRIEKQTNSSN